MFAFRWNTLSGSKRALRSASRRHFASEYARRTPASPSAEARGDVVDRLELEVRHLAHVLVDRRAKRAEGGQERASRFGRARPDISDGGHRTAVFQSTGPGSERGASGSVGDEVGPAPE